MENHSFCLSEIISIVFVTFVSLAIMSDVIATVWDFDKTLIPGYMQDPIFAHFDQNGSQFLQENNAEIQSYEETGLTVNHDTYYLNKFIRESQPGGKFDGLNNKLLEQLGAKLEFCPGAIDLFKEIHALNENKTYKEFGIKFENYIVSTGFKRMIQGSAICPYVKKIWGAELIDKKGQDGKERLAEVAYSLDNTTKTRAIFEINKGVGIVEDSTIDVNTKIPLEERRVRFCNMIYVADGPSDVPVFSLLNQKGGATLAVYQKGNMKAFQQVDQLSRDGRVQMIAEADYTKDSIAHMWLTTRLSEQANAIIEKIKSAYKKSPGTPQHIV